MWSPPCIEKLDRKETGLKLVGILSVYSQPTMLVSTILREYKTGRKCAWKTQDLTVRI